MQHSGLICRYWCFCIWDLKMTDLGHIVAKEKRLSVEFHSCKANWHIFGFTLWPPALHWSHFFELICCFLLCSKDPLFSSPHAMVIHGDEENQSSPPSNFTHDEASVARPILFRAEGLSCLDVACGKVVYLLQSFMLSRLQREIKKHRCTHAYIHLFEVQSKETAFLLMSKH